MLDKSEIEQIRRRFFELQGRHPTNLTWEDVNWYKIAVGKLLHEIEWRDKFMEGLTEGRIVHYVLENGEHRPAIVVRVWRYPDPDVEDQSKAPLIVPHNGCCQLQVFTDSDAEGKFNDGLPPIMWKTSVTFDAEKSPGSWHWIEKA